MDGPLVDDKLILPPPSTNVLKLAGKAGASASDGGSSNSDGDTGDDTSGSSNIELWTFRLPVGLNVSALEGVEIRLDDDGWQGRFRAGVPETEYQVAAGCSTENETFRVLVPAASKSDDLTTRRKKDSDSDEGSDDDDDEDSDDSSGKGDGRKDAKTKLFLYPAPKPFRRHFNVTKTFPKRSEMELAPSEGPEPLDPMRHSYAPIPQRSGLKRRWMPQGVAGVQAAAAASAEQSASESSKKSKSTAAPDANSNDKSTRRKSSSTNDGDLGTTVGIKDVDMDEPPSQDDDHEDSDTMPSRKRIKTGGGNQEDALTKEERKAQKKAAKKAAKKAEKKMKKKIEKGEASQEA
jgi:hypothetical protein